MPILFKLSGYQNIPNIIDTFEGYININVLIELFKFWGVVEDDIMKIKFISDSEIINNSNKNYEITKKEIRVIYVFTSNEELRNKLSDIFIKNGNFSEQVELGQNQTKNIEQQKEDTVINEPDSEISKPLNKEESDKIVLTPDIIESVNKKTIELFQDDDFKSLLRIYLKRPELFSVLAKYVQDGNVVDEIKNDETLIKSLTQEEFDKYKELAEHIMKLNILSNITYDYIIQKLFIFNGNINLTLRHILCEHV